MKTYQAKASEVNHDWYVVNADGKTLGRLATGIARVLTGKHKPTYTPHVDTGDFVIVINAGRVVVTGRKPETKFYTRHSQYPGGFRKILFQDQIQKHPDKVITSAVWGMLPHNRLGRQMLKKLKVYPASTHPHQAQQPKELAL